MNTPEQRAAYVQSQVACAVIEAMGMQAENQMRDIQGDSPAYTYKDFVALLDRYSIHHNAVMEMMR